MARSGPATFGFLALVATAAAASLHAPVRKNSGKENATHPTLVAVAHGMDMKLSNTRSTGRISPTLKPVSHDTFFKKDYPDDLRPGVGNKFNFDHPYPTVQDSGDFDKDYVKDENSDNGEWKAQMEYDSLRTQIKKQQKKVDEARKRLEAAKKVIDEDKAEEGSASSSAEEARKKADEARRRDKEEQDKVDDIAGDGKNNNGALGDAVHEVDGEVSDLEKCKKKLTDAQKKLAELEKEKKEREQNLADSEEELKPLKNQEAELKSKADAAKAEAKQKEDEAKKSAKTYEEELADVKKTEAELEEAHDRLRGIRKKEDPHGAVTYKKSSSHRIGTNMLLSVMAVLTLSTLA